MKTDEMKHFYIGKQHGFVALHHSVRSASLEANQMLVCYDGQQIITKGFQIKNKANMFHWWISENPILGNSYSNYLLVWPLCVLISDRPKYGRVDVFACAVIPGCKNSHTTLFSQTIGAVQLCICESSPITTSVRKLGNGLFCVAQTITGAKDLSFIWVFW